MTPLAHQELDGFRAQAEVFNEIFLVFLILGTLVGIVVVAYMLSKAYKYRHGASPPQNFEAPSVGELPTGGSGARKLFLSFGISAVIVISLVAWTYMALIYVEAGAQEVQEADYEVEIQAHSFFWEGHYSNGNETFNDIFIPAESMVNVSVTAPDDEVWHTLGVPELRLKADAIPGQTSETWIAEDDQGNYTIKCYELCGPGHSGMQGTLHVISQAEFEQRFVQTNNESSTSDEQAADLSGVATSAVGLATIAPIQGGVPT